MLPAARGPHIGDIPRLPPFPERAHDWSNVSAAERRRPGGCRGGVLAATRGRRRGTPPRQPALRYGSAMSFNTNGTRTTVFGVFICTRSFQSGCGLPLHVEITVSPSSPRVLTRWSSPFAST